MADGWVYIVSVVMLGVDEAPQAVPLYEIVDIRQARQREQNFTARMAGAVDLDEQPALGGFARQARLIRG